MLRTRVGLIAVVILLGNSQSSRADLYEFANGGKIRGEARSRDGVVTFELAGRSYSFLEKAFRRIVREERFEDIWVNRCGDLKQDRDFDHWVQAALWALEQGRTAESVALLREMAAAFPDESRPQHLLAVLKAIEAPKAIPQTRMLRHALNASFQEETTANVLFLHQGDKGRAKDRAGFYEEMVLVFYLESALRGVDLNLPKSKVICVEWGQREAYLAFLKRQNAGAFQATTGFYHPTLRVIVGYRTALKAKPDHRLAAELDRKGLEDPTQADYRRRMLLKASQMLTEEVGTAAHEMVHLLVQLSGLVSTTDDFPLWLQEGLAMQYECVEAGRWAGINRVQEVRLGDWRTLKSPAKLEEVLRDDGFGNGYRKETYAKSWALVYFLRTQKPREFQNFLDRLSLPPLDSDKSANEKTIRAFRESFGNDLDLIGREWIDALAKTRTCWETEGTQDPSH